MSVINYVLLLCTFIISVSCRPSSSSLSSTSTLTQDVSSGTTQNDPVVEVERQNIIELKPDPRTIDDNVDKVNLLRDTNELLEKIDNANRLQKMNDNVNLKRPIIERDRNEVRMLISEEPFKNPILQYLLLNGNNRSPVGLMTKNTSPTNVPFGDDDDNLSGRSVTRKITHHQTLIFPMFDMMDNYLPYDMDLPYANNPNNLSRSELEKQTIQNVKNIVQTSQQRQPQPERNDLYNYSPYYPYLTNVRDNNEKSNVLAKQWSPPLQNIFPIVIKNPFQTMFNAFTSMVEYGPEADVCKHGRNGRLLKIDQKDETENENYLQQHQQEQHQQEQHQQEQQQQEQQQQEQQQQQRHEQENVNEGIVIENFDVSNNDEESNQTSEDNNIRNVKELREDGKKMRPTRPPQSSSHYVNDDVAENEKGLFTSDNNKRQATRQNIGGGIFIQKLRVRKGGVAIAGPGGIATAGTGGTAIVGPNGYAYTHPDSLAIAGTGTKVIAVDPSIDLTKIVNESGIKNKSKSDDNISRFGKIVAVGPVVYYNQG